MHKNGYCWESWDLEVRVITVELILYIWNLFVNSLIEQQYGGREIGASSLFV